MSSLLYVASGDDEIVDHADWVEASTLFRADGSTSQEDLARAIHIDRSLSQQRARELAEDAFEELNDRIDACRVNCHPNISCYPFELMGKNTVLQRKPPVPPDTDAGLLYLFLLVLSRSNMGSTARARNAIDPTKVFERLCADVLKDFWGGQSAHSDSLVFGTAHAGGQRNFESHINQLCNFLQEGMGWKNGARSPGAGVGKLEIVVYRRFCDKRPVSLVGFAQCKTGIHWREHLTKLQPSGFCHNYMTNPLVVEPMRIYMVPHRIVANRWDEDSRAGGLLFDRCRIVNYGNSIKPMTLKNCSNVAAIRPWPTRKKLKTPLPFYLPILCDVPGIIRGEVDRAPYQAR